MNRAPVDPSDPSSYLPLTPAVFHILLSLAPGMRHGYGVIADVRERTAGRIRLGTGTLYTAINRLLEQGLIEETGEPGDDRRRTYRLLPLGEAVARAEAGRLQALLGLAAQCNLLPATEE